MDDADFGSAYADVYLQAAMQNRWKPGGEAAGDCVDTCEACGEEIPKGRRDAMPGCRLCVTCQTLFEKGAR